MVGLDNPTDQLPAPLPEYLRGSSSLAQTGVDFTGRWMLDSPSQPDLLHFGDSFVAAERFAAQAETTVQL